MKITKGKWKVEYENDDNTQWYNAGPAIVEFYYVTGNEELAKANANLIAEAGTVANETGFTPRQLVDKLEVSKITIKSAFLTSNSLRNKNKELREALESLVNFTDVLLRAVDEESDELESMAKARKALKTPKQ